MLQGPTGLSRAPRPRLVSPWTKQRTRVLRRRWAQGARVRDIAAELGHGITYNAVIGKIHASAFPSSRPTVARPADAPQPTRAPPIGPWTHRASPGGSGKGRRRLGSSMPSPMSRLLTPTRASRAASAARSSN
jgi:hypothetical protein